MTVTIDDIRAVSAVDKHAVLENAAHELGTTVYSVSQSIERVESFIGEPLFYMQDEAILKTKRGHEVMHVFNRMARTFNMMERSK